METIKKSNTYLKSVMVIQVPQVSFPDQSKTVVEEVVAKTLSFTSTPEMKTSSNGHGTQPKVPSRL